MCIRDSVFDETIKNVLEWETEDCMHDLWRRSIMKYYNRALGNRDYSLFEVVHNGFRLPATVSNFGNVESVSGGSWGKIKTGATLKRLKTDQRATYLTKLEMLNCRFELERPKGMSVDELKNLSFYACLRFYSVQKARSLAGAPRNS